MTANRAFSKILVAYDGSDYSERALQKARCLLQKDAQMMLYVLNVVDPDISLASSAKVYQELSKKLLKGEKASSAIIYQQMLNALSHQSEQLVEMAVAQLSDLPNHVESAVIEGSPKHEIVQMANDKQVDLILIGSRGLSEIKELFLGSVSQYVVQHAECPVLIVK